MLLSWAAYNKELHTAGLPAGTNEIGLPWYIASHGYAHVVVPRRATASSAGDVDMWFSPREQADGLAGTVLGTAGGDSALTKP